MRTLHCVGSVTGFRRALAVDLPNIAVHYQYVVVQGPWRSVNVAASATPSKYAVTGCMMLPNALRLCSDLYTNTQARCVLPMHNTDYTKETHSMLTPHKYLTLLCCFGLLTAFGCEQLNLSKTSEAPAPAQTTKAPPALKKQADTETQEPTEKRLEKASTPLISKQSRKDSFRDLVQKGTLSTEGFETHVRAVSLDNTTGPSLTSRNARGIAFKALGSITNNTSKTLTQGALTPILLMQFGDKTVKVALGPDALSPPASPTNPWRSGEKRAIEGKTFILPKVLAEYQPTNTNIALIASFMDPIEYNMTQLIWSMPVPWLALRGVPVKGTARVTRTEILRGGLRNSVVGRVQPDEVVELLYQKGDAFRVQANDGIGWVSADSLQLKNLNVYTDARPYGGSLTAEDEDESIKIHSIATINQAPEGIRLSSGERLLIADVQITNKSVKDIKCPEIFIDYGPRRQLAVVRGNDVFSDAFRCERNVLSAGQSLRGKVAFVRGRLDIPFSIGFATPARSPLMVDVYDPKDTAAWTKP